MKTHKLAKAKLLKAIPGHRVGHVITRRAEHIDKLIQMGIAEPLEVKQEKTPIETKEEKFAPSETKDFTDISLSKLAGKVKELSDDDLLDIVKADYRKGAVALAQEELSRRG